MKRNLLVVVVAAALCANSVGAADALQQLRVSAAKAGTEVVRAFAYGSVDVSSVRDVFRAASPAVRASLVEGVLVWTKAYVDSPQFAKDYAAIRAEAKPVLEKMPSVDEELKARRAQRQKDLDEARKSVAEAPAEYRAAMQEGLNAAIEANKQFDTADFRRMERESIEQEQASARQSYEDDLQNWEASYPAEPRALVRERLETFLELTAGVDFGAKTVNRWGKQRFVSEEYESKPSEWKLAYRAGKEPTEKARAFAKAWLAELK